MEKIRNIAKNQIVKKDGCLVTFYSYECKIATYNAKTLSFTFYTNENGDLYAFSSRTTAKYLRDFIDYDTDATYKKKEQILKAIDCHQIETEVTKGNDYTEKKFK